MGFVFNRSRAYAERDIEPWGISGPGDMIPRRVSRSAGYGGFVTDRQAFETSAVWAAIRLRADLVSTLPMHCYRVANLGPVVPGIALPSDVQRIDAPLSPFMSGQQFRSFMYMSQAELDSSGNAIGIIHSWDGQHLPLDIELVPSNAIDIVVDGGTRKIKEYRLYGEPYTPDKVWHEKQFEKAGMHVGLSPIAYAAYSLGQYKSVQNFATEWFTAGQGPRSSLKNTIKKISTKEAATAKEAWRASQSMGEPFVHGNDWEYNLYQAQQASTDWIESQKLTLQDISRFFGVPADLIDAALAGGSNITYANVTQRNLQFLVMHLGPALARREEAFSYGLLPRPRMVEFDAHALLRMDPETRAAWIKTQIDSRTLTLNEARAMDNRGPLTDADYKQWELAGLNKTATGALTGADNLPVPPGTQTEPVPPAAEPATPDKPATPPEAAPNNQGNK